MCLMWFKQTKTEGFGIRKVKAFGFCLLMLKFRYDS